MGDVIVTFEDEEARAEFEDAWSARTGGPPVDRIENGVQYTGANAERALDIGSEMLGVTVRVS